MRRTISDARQHLEANAAGLNPAAYGQLTDEINEAIGSLTKRAAADVDDRYQQTISSCLTTGEELCRLRDDARTITADVEAGRIRASDAATRINELRRNLRQHTTATDHHERAVTDIAAIEDDPVGWYDTTIFARFPDLRPDFSF